MDNVSPEKAAASADDNDEDFNHDDVDGNDEGDDAIGKKNDDLT